MRGRNLGLAYLLLVGAPALGLLGILRAGQHVIPPISVGGAWNLDADFSALGSAPCARLLAGIKQPIFTISQSGTNLQLSLNGAATPVLAGAIRGATLTAGTEDPPASGTAPAVCGGLRSLYLKGAVSKPGDQRVLTGTLGIGACAQCLPVPFRAVRQSSPANGDQ